MLSQLLVPTTDAKQHHIFNGATITYQIKTVKAVLWQLRYILGAHVALYVVGVFPKVQIA